MIIGKQSDTDISFSKWNLLVSAKPFLYFLMFLNSFIATLNNFLADHETP